MNPYKFNEPICIAFSGGRSSGFMTRNIIQAGMPNDSICVFCNTGKEDEAVLRFVRDFGINFGIKIIWLEFRDDEIGFAIVDFNSASRNGEPFEKLINKRQYLPNPVTRFCTIEMKIRITAKYCKSIGLDIGENESIVGFRADEPRRVSRLADKSRAPMYLAGHTKNDVMQFWNSNGFDLELPNINGVTPHGNCDLCFLKGEKTTRSLIHQKPSRADWWANMEALALALASKPDGAIFRKDRDSYAVMRDYALAQSDMFGYEWDSGIDCFCGD